MSDYRLQNLPERQLISLIKKARTQLNGLRHAAQRFGSASVKMFRVFSTDTSDITVTNVKFNNRVIEVTFTPDDNTDPNLGGVLDFQYTWSFSSTGSPVYIYEEPQVPSGGISKWRLYLSASDSSPNQSISMKFYFFANASGTFTAALL